MIARQLGPAPRAIHGTKVDAWHSGTGKVLRVGDVVRKGSSAKLWRVREIIERPSGSVDVTVVGYSKMTRAADAGFRTFTPDDLTTDRRKTAEAAQADAARAAEKTKGKAS